MKTPLLVVSALDDPLHHPDHIGMPLFQEAQNPHIAMWFTGTGGHVAWPEAGQAPFSFMNRVSVEWVTTIEAGHATQV